MALLSFPFNTKADDFDIDPFHLLTARRPGSALSQNRESPANLVRNFSPRFDVRESKDAYHLDGELPGMDQKDIEIEFSDPHTLVIKGHSARAYERSNEDDENEEATSAVATAGQTREDQKTKQDKKKPQSQYKYWVSERSSGSFHRTFNFPLLVDQDAVKASLRNGILAVHVPKQATKKPSKRIQVE